MPEKQLDSKAKLFCTYYYLLGNIREAAIKAGYSPLFAEKKGAHLLGLPEIKAEILKISKAKASDNIAKSGLMRLAFGTIADAVKLIQSEENLQQISPDELDLFNVSEIKKQKGGGFEIKFFDRFKALEKLCDLETRQTSESSLPFFEALEKSAKCLNEALPEDFADDI